MQIVFDITLFLLLVHLTFRWNSVLARRATDDQDFPIMRQVLLWGLVIKLSLISIWYFAAGGHEFNMSVVDAEFYDSLGNYIGDRLRHFAWPYLMDQEKIGFAYVVGILYAIFGSYHIVVSIFNILLSVWTAMMIFEITYVITKNNHAGLYAYIAAMFYPHFISASYLLLKDMTAAFSLVAMVWAVYCLNKIPMKILFLTFMITILAHIRMQMAIVTVVLLAIQTVLNRENIFQRINIASKFIFNLGLVIIVVVAVIAFYNLEIGGQVVGESGYTLPTVEEGGLMVQEDVRIMPQCKGSANLFSEILARPVAYIIALAVSFIRIFFGPFFLYAAEGVNLTPYAPDEVGFRAVLESLGGLYTGLMLPFIVFGFFVFMKSNRRDVIIWGFPALWLVLMTLSMPIIRWRLPLIALVFVFFGMGIQFTERIKKIYPTYIIMLLFLLAFNASRLQGFVLSGGIIAAFIAVIIQVKILRNRTSW